MSRFLTIVNGMRTLAAAILQSAGSADAGKIPATSSNGRLHNSLINWDAPSAIGSDTPNTLKGTTLNLTSTAQSFDSLPGTAGALQCAGGISAAGNIVSGGYLAAKGDLFVDAVGSSQAAPRIVGAVNLIDGTAAAFQFGGPFNRIYGASGAGIGFTAYWGLDFYGCNYRNNGTAPYFTGTNYSTCIWDLGGDLINLVLRPISSVTKTANFVEVRSAANALLTSIDSNGRLIIAVNSQATSTTTGDIVARGIGLSGNLYLGGTLAHQGSSLGFYNASPVSKPTITGSRGDGTALASLLTQLASLGLITDSTTA